MHIMPDFIDILTCAGDPSNIQLSGLSAGK
jgi:hypothetical protein